jgi:hypothetical protein
MPDNNKAQPQNPTNHSLQVVISTTLGTGELANQHNKEGVMEKVVDIIEFVTYKK